MGIRGFPAGSAIKNSPASAGDAGNVGSVRVGKIPLEEEVATHASILAWRIPWTEDAGGLQSMSHNELDTTE